MARKFQKKVEDFVCENCGAEVSGNGYTNHCPRCLYSKDVDVNPGDRASKCGGLMAPIGIEIKNGDYIIVHKCAECGKIRKNKSAPEDSFDMILEIMKNKI
ncbi:MAG: RNHCP domain-containing protein [Rickettsiales bacterium]|jgi:rubrerythrin|nr:RNHCP domain-containing protein [Rickettsiales bacterium]